MLDKQPKPTGVKGIELLRVNAPSYKDDAFSG